MGIRRGGEVHKGQGKRGNKVKSAEVDDGNFLWYVFIAWLRWGKHHGVIKNKTKQLFLVSSVVALLQAEVFTESKVRGQRRFNTLVQARHSSWEF